MSALKVVVTQDRENFVHFLVRISSVVAGIIVISGYLNSLIQLVVDFLTGNNESEPFNYQPMKTALTANLVLPDDAVLASGMHKHNHLISNANQMANIPFNFTVKKL